MTAIAAGDGTLTLLRDGHDRLPLELFSPRPGGDDLLDAPDAETVEIPINAFLYETSDRCVLIDGGGAGLSPDLGAVAGWLRERGVAPERIDTIFCTHLHPDHTGGLLIEGAPAFPSATLMLHEAEKAFWLGVARPEDNDPFAALIDNARATLSAYADRTVCFGDGDAIAPGATVRHLPGHTPGHSGVLFGGGDEAVLMWGDIVHWATAQLARPETSVLFDVDAAQAVETRTRLLSEIAARGTRVAGCHLPGIGRLHGAAQGVVFNPETAE